MNLALHSPNLKCRYAPNWSGQCSRHELKEISSNQRPSTISSLEICVSGGVVSHTHSRSAESLSSLASPQTLRTNPQHRRAHIIATQSTRNIDDDPSTDDIVTNATNSGNDGNEGRAQYVSANCVVFTHYRGDAATEVEEHFQRALMQDKEKEWYFCNIRPSSCKADIPIRHSSSIKCAYNISPMNMRNFPPSFWKTHHHSNEIYEYAADPWHSHYPQYHHRSVHEYHHHNMAAAASYGGLLLGGSRSLGHHSNHHPTHHAHAAGTSWSTTSNSQSLVEASSPSSYHHGPYASLSGDYWT